MVIVPYVGQFIKSVGVAVLDTAFESQATVLVLQGWKLGDGGTHGKTLAIDNRKRFL